MNDIRIGNLLCPLFVPGDRLDRFDKALHSGADGIILDLEDAVAESSKSAARQNVAEYLSRNDRETDTSIGVRVNGPQTGLLHDDLRSISPVTDMVDFLVVPMVENASTVTDTIQILSHFSGKQTTDLPPITALIETAGGIYGAREVAAHPHVSRLGFGVADLSADLQVDETEAASLLDTLRSELVLASAAAGLAPPLDGPPLQIGDEDAPLASTQHSKSTGMFGRVCIHPSQLAAVKKVFVPSSEAIAHADRVWQAFGKAESGGSASIKLDDGTFIDYPIAARAKTVLELAETFGKYEFNR